MSSLQAESRKPLNYACATVVLDNQDGFIQQAERIGRIHIYRSGDSEYKIDGKKVRLEMCMICSWIRIRRVKRHENEPRLVAAQLSR